MNDGGNTMNAVRAVPRHDGATDRTTLLTALDRRAIAAIVQVVPSDRYTLALRLPDSDLTGWVQGRIGDLTGDEVLSVIEAGQMCLCLADVGALIVHDHPDLAVLLPEVTATGDRIHHGLVIASPHLALAVPPGSRNGSIHVLEGSLSSRLLEPGETQASGSTVRLAAGDTLDRIGTRTTRLDVGDALVVALTRCETVPPPDTAGVRACGILSRVLRRFTGSEPVHRRPTLIEAVFAPQTWPSRSAGAPPSIHRLVRNRGADEVRSDTGD